MSEPAGPTTSWLDWQRALAIVDDDLELLARLVDVFIGQYRGVAEELRMAVRADDWDAVARRAHQLAGAAGAIGAVPLEQQARCADAAARAPGNPSVTMDVRQQWLSATGSLVQHLEWTLQQADAWRKGLHGKA